MNNDLKRVGLVFTEKGAVDFKKSLQEINIEMNKNYNQFKLTQAQWDKSTTSTEKLKAQQEYLTNAYQIQEDKVKTLRMQLSDLENAEKKNTTAIKKKQNELTNAEIKLKTYEKNLENTSSTLYKLENGLETTEEKIKRLDDEIENLDNTLKDNESTFKLVQSQWTKSTSTTQKLKDEQMYLEKTFETQTEKIKILKEQLIVLENAENKDTNAISKKRIELKNVAIELNNYKNKIQDVECKLNNAGKKLEEFGKKIEENGSKIEKSGEKIEKVGSKLSAFSVATGTAFVTSAKSAIDFEDAVTGVYKTVDGTAEQLATIEQGIRKMAKSIPASTTEIAGVAEAAGQLGIATDDILSFTRVMIDLGNSTNLSAEEAASSLAKFANITNMSAKDYDKLGSVIVGLGNNFATTEADIVSMATRLAATGELTGLSQAQIMALAASMSSVGIEAEAGGSAMSKLLKKVQVSTETGGKSLQQFAKVAGMSTSQFKKAFKEDAVGAISAFLKGLQDTKRNGKSAIAVLEDMDIKEVNLSNTILSLSNASEVMNNAVKVANKSWEDNTALTNEANKRYDTLKSKTQIAMNKFKDLSITLGNKLTPTISKVIDKIEDFTGWVENLTDEEVEFILKTGLAVTALGPFLKIMGNITTTSGKVVKGIGTFTQAVGVMKGNVTSSSEAVNGLAGFMTKLTSPVGIATLAVTALAGAWAIGKIHEKELTKEMQNSIDKIQEEIEARRSLTEAVEKEQSATLSQMQNVADLTEELDLLVDENGKVKEGYEDRTNFILTQLNKALGTEFTMTGNVINKYKELKKSVEDVIRTKQANAILEAEEQLYNEAINNKATAYESVAKAQQDVLNYQNKIAEWENKNGKIDNSFMGKLKRGFKTNTKDLTELENLKKQLDKANEEMSKAETNYKQIMDNINTYTQDATVLLGKDVEAQKELLNKKMIAHNDTSEDIAESTKLTIDNYLYDLEMLKKYKNEAIAKQDSYSAEYYKIQIETNKKSLEEQIKYLASMTSTTQEMTPKQIEAWRALAKGAYDVYEEQLCKMPSEMAQNIQNITGVVITQTPEVVSSAQQMSQKVVNELDKDSEFRTKALKDMYAFLNGLSDSNLRALLETAGVQNVDKVIQGIRKGNLAEDEGINILKSLNNGLQNSSFSGTLFATAKSIASRLSGLLTVKPTVSNVITKFQPLNSTIKGHKLGLDYVPKDNYLARLHKGERVLTKEENEEYSEAEKNARKSGNVINVINYDKIAAAISSAITSSNARLENLLTKILEKNSSIVLDTGVLVGETVEKMDIALGDLSNRQERG